MVDHREQQNRYERPFWWPIRRGTCKKVIVNKQSSGDLFTLPFILGIMIGRMGCFLAGTSEFTYDKTTMLFLRMDLGDGLLRHTITLYEVAFQLLLSLG